jgi:hypothetical protein
MALFPRRVVSGTDALGLYQLKMTSQFDTVLVDLVPRFAALKSRQQRVCKISPRNPEQFLQSIDVADQNFQFAHAGSPYQRRDAFAKLSLIRLN